MLRNKNGQRVVLLGALLASLLFAWAPAASGEGVINRAKHQPAATAAEAETKVAPEPPKVAGDSVHAAQIRKRPRRQATLHERSSQIGTPQQQGSSSGLDDKLDTARQLVQKIRERCLSGLEQQRRDSREGFLSRDRSEFETSVRERASSSIGGDRLTKLGELGDKVKNKTNDAREVLQNIRMKCAEILGGDSHSKEHDHDQGHSHHREPHRLRRRRQVYVPSTAPQSATGQVQNTALELFNSGQAALAALGEQVRGQAGAVVQQAQGLRDQLMASVDKQVASVNQQQVPKRLVRRQIEYPQLQPQPQPGPAVPNQVGPSPVQPASGGFGSGVMKYINDLGQQSAQAQAIQQILQAVGASGSQGPTATGANQPIGLTAGSNVAQMLTQLADLIKDTRARAARLMETNQRSLEQTGEQTADVAKSATGGVQAAIVEMTQGLQRLAANNPNLVPDISNLYQAISARLSSAVNPANQPTSPIGGPNQVGRPQLPA